MKHKIFQADAFTSELFGGNPAAVCPLDSWLPDELMQKIAMENNLSETAFFVPENGGFRLRWFTPAVEIDLCGHATLATAHILFNHLRYDKDQISFQSRSGLLTVKREGQMLLMDFPKDELTEIETPAVLKKAIAVTPKECYKGKNIVMAVLSSQQEIEELDPVIDFIRQTHPHGVIFTAKGRDVDFVSRCFFPNCGINEDPVTGSAHTILTPYWAEKLGKKRLSALQLSKRKGVIFCELKNDRVLLSGRAVTFLTGEIET